jgi:hypothetical protein
MPSAIILGVVNSFDKGTLNYPVTQLRITNQPNSSPKGLIGCPSTSPWPGLKFARFSRSSYKPTTLPHFL